MADLRAELTTEITVKQVNSARANLVAVGNCIHMSRLKMCLAFSPEMSHT